MFETDYPHQDGTFPHSRRPPPSSSATSTTSPSASSPGATPSPCSASTSPREHPLRPGEAGGLGRRVITGLDLREPADDELVAGLRAELLEHLVICIRGQAALTPDDHVAFARRWGTIVPHPYVEPVEGHPEMIRIYDPNPLTETWHADFTYERTPPAISLLLGRVIPRLRRRHRCSPTPTGSSTGSATGSRTPLRGMRALHQGTALAMSKGLTIDEITTVHPVVARHPDTGASC